VKTASGHTKVLFGTNCPMIAHHHALAGIEDLGLDEDAPAATCTETPNAEGTRWTAQIRPTVADVFRIHAQRYGSRIRHEDEKHASAISMRILQTCR
jgi:hypothetical protein